MYPFRLFNFRHHNLKDVKKIRKCTEKSHQGKGGFQKQYLEEIIMTKMLAMEKGSIKGLFVLNIQLRK